MTQAIGPIFTPTASAVLVAKTATGILSDAICTPSVAGYFMLFDAVAAPADGAVSPNLCVAVASGASVSLITPTNTGVTCLKGIVLVFSTTGPFVKTTTTGTAHMSARVT